MTSKGRMTVNDKLETTWEKAVVASCKLLAHLRKIMKNQSAGRD